MSSFFTRIINFFKQLYDIIYFIIISFIKEIIPDTFNSNSDPNVLKLTTKGQILYLKSDSLFREEPDSSSNIITVLIKGTKVKFQNDMIIKNNGEIFDKIALINNEDINDEKIGYILRSQLSSNVILEQQQSISILNKTKIIQEISKILKMDTVYSNDKQKRTYGYFDKKYEGRYYFDSSSFCSYILKKIFNFEENNIWTTNDYLKNSTKDNSKFEVIENITTQGQSIDISKLQIGDLIIGVASNIGNGINHMMIYVGEGNIVHCTNDRFLGIKSNKLRNGVVKESIIDSNYYTELETLGNLINVNITKRFDISITVLRYKDENKN